MKKSYLLLRVLISCLFFLGLSIKYSRAQPSLSFMSYQIPDTMFMDYSFVNGVKPFNFQVRNNGSAAISGLPIAILYQTDSMFTVGADNYDTMAVADGSFTILPGESITINMYSLPGSSTYGSVETQNFRQGLNDIIIWPSIFTGSAADSIYETIAVVDLSTSLKSEFPQLNSVEIFPNPVQAGNKFFVDYSEPGDILSIAILDQNVKYISEWRSGHGTLVADRRLSSGVYTLEIRFKDGTVSFRKLLVIN